MTDTVVAPSAEPGVPAEPAGRWTRWSDRLNPILVREVQQAVKGRVFVLTVCLALAISLIIAIVVAGQYEVSAGSGRHAFDAGLATLVPLLLFVVPMQAYQSMRLEMRAGIVEQLLLSELRPWRIVVGKLAAAMVQFVLYVAVMAPLLSTSYLLRGVDVPSIALSLAFAMVTCLAATAFAVSSAAQGALPSMQALANVAVAAGLGVTTFALLGYVGSGEYARDVAWLVRSNEFGLVTSMTMGGCLAGTVLSALCAQTFLAHAFENRSTPFRVFLCGMIVATYGWVWLFVEPTHRDEAASVAAIFLVLIGAAFGLFMVTEQSGLSPRVAAHVPRQPLLALLAAPWLPGRDRGLLAFVLYLPLAASVGVLAVSVVGHSWRDEFLRILLFTSVYSVIYLCIGRWLRARLPNTLAGNHVARVGVPLVLLLACVLPLLFDAFLRGRVSGWHVGHALNPFFTIDEFDRSRGEDVLLGLWGLAGLLLLLQVPSLLRGVREVVAASAARRARTST